MKHKILKKNRRFRIRKKHGMNSLLENRRLELFSMLQTLLPLTERADALQGIFDEIDIISSFDPKCDKDCHWIYTFCT